MGGCPTRRCACGWRPWWRRCERVAVMSEWWSYDLADLLMFSPRAWYRLLELHNRAWWPLQPIAMASGIGVLWAIHRRVRAALPLGLLLLGASMLFAARLIRA